MNKFYSAYRVPLSATAGTAGVLNLLNPEGSDVYISRVILEITTKATGACTLDAGIHASGASSDNLIDGLDVGTAAGVFDNLKNPGTNGKAGQKWAAGSKLTVSQASGSVAGMVGNLYVEYVRLG